MMPPYCERGSREEPSLGRKMVAEVLLRNGVFREGKQAFPLPLERQPAGISL